MKQNILVDLQSQVLGLGYFCVEVKKLIGTRLPSKDVVVGWGPDSDNEIVVPGIAVCVIEGSDSDDDFLVQDVIRYVESKFGAIRTLALWNGVLVDGHLEKINEQSLAIPFNTPSDAWVVYSPELITRLILEQFQAKRTEFGFDAFFDVLLTLGSLSPMEKDGQYLVLAKDILQVCWLKLANERGFPNSELWSSPASLISAMVNLADSDGFKPKSILDPFMGAGALLQAAANRFGAAEVHGMEINKQIFDVAAFFISSAETDLKNADSMTESWPKVDLVVSHPPFGVKASSPVLGPTMATRNLELATIDKALDALKPGGRAVLCLTRGWTFRNDESSNLRRYLSSRGDVHVKAIIGLPALFKMTTIETCLLVLERSNQGETLVAELGADWENQLSKDSQLISSLDEK